ncbi:probable UDP-3-O-acylglucosamine N-acyltransferase 2, mitochondrial isoform X2 [Dendrobium catenatum]|uniref:probable UDP-3-O-acylglucosamine N-acyltransferase 2, mitochondrial isoform X2 n=1 Tax=Dendrobium catenatum TaxID=906689 RepID=UPI0010A02540|nr:probable UDP-3-O-acylglucosamine N-acyltransferase 2, mitochondrial isoform X2 [Dendrobium catenatum]
MSFTGRRAFSSLFCLSKRAFSQHLLEPSGSRSSILHSKPTGPEQTARGSLEFAEWHNGGGLFHRTASVDPSVFIEVGAIVHQKAVIGADVHIGSGSIVGPSVSIGQSTNIMYNAVLSNCSVGMSCVIHNGSCIGQDGFGFFVDKEGNMTKKPQIGHNAVIGKCCMLCGQVGIAGSVTMGDYCTLAGRVAVKDHVTISSKVRLAANSGVTKDVGEPGDYAGFPAVPVHQWRRQSASLRRLSKKDLKESGS